MGLRTGSHPELWHNQSLQSLCDRLGNPCHHIVYPEHPPIREQHSLSKLLPQGWEGGASRWCRAWCMSGCSNLDPVRRGSLIPDYSSLGLRHADAQVCTHLQPPHLSIWLSALNLKPHPDEYITAEAVATVLVPEMRHLVKDVGILVWTIQSNPAVWFEMFSSCLML